MGPSAGTPTVSLKRRLSASAPTDGGARKRPKACHYHRSDPVRPSGSAAAAATLDRATATTTTTTTTTMQPPLPPSRGVTGAGGALYTNTVVPPDTLAQFSRDFGSPYPTLALHAPPVFSSRACPSDDLTGTLPAEMEYGLHRASTVSRAIQSCDFGDGGYDGDGGPQQIGYVSQPPPDSPATVGQSSDMDISSSSPGPARRKRECKPTDEPHVCERCSKDFPRACDLK